MRPLAPSLRHALLLFSVTIVTVAITAPRVSGQAQETALSDGGMVSSQQWIASQVGADVLAAGGNAVDAAIATGFALAVTHPTAGNIGGGGFMVIRFPNGQSTTIDFREKAPLGAHPEMWLDENGEYSFQVHHLSHRAVGVPGTVAGFDKAHRLYGAADWTDLVAPSVELAMDGFELSDALAGSIARFASGRGAGYEASVAAFTDNGTPYSGGDTWRQPDLGSTLERIRDARSDGFYRGSNSGEVRGAGLGLGIVQHFARAHGGEIQALPRRGGGTIMRLTLPLSGRDAAATDRTGPSGAAPDPNDPTPPQEPRP